MANDDGIRPESGWQPELDELHLRETLARRMGGDITARSPGPGLGAVFTVSLAVAPPQLAGAEAAHG